MTPFIELNKMDEAYRIGEAALMAIVMHQLPESYGPIKAVLMQGDQRPRLREFWERLQTFEDQALSARSSRYSAPSVTPLRALRWVPNIAAPSRTIAAAYRALRSLEAATAESDSTS